MSEGRAPDGDALHELERDGFVVLRDVWAAADIDGLLAKLGRALGDTPAGRSGSHRLARSLWPIVRPLAGHPRLDGLLRSALGGPAELVRAILFDKPPASSWLVPWHRDVVFPSERRRRDRLATATLERMVIVRAQLDDGAASGGGLRVLPGSHRGDDLGARPAAPPAPDAGQLVDARRGDVLVMRPLLLHRSSRGGADTHRRVLHLDLIGVRQSR